MTTAHMTFLQNISLLSKGYCSSCSSDFDQCLNLSLKLSFVLHGQVQE